MPVTAVFRFHKDYGVIAILPEYIYPLTRRPEEYVITAFIHLGSDYFNGCLYEEVTPQLFGVIILNSERGY